MPAGVALVKSCKNKNNKQNLQVGYTLPRWDISKVEYITR